MPIHCKGEACAGKKKRAEYGLKDSGKRKWCFGCAKKQVGEMERIGATGKIVCEFCPQKWAHYGKEGSTKAQWCAICAEAHGGVRLGKQKMCQDCGKRRANYGLVGTREKQWCSRCANEQEGETTHIGGQMCEGCHLRHASFGEEGGTKRQWCATCAKARGGVSMETGLPAQQTSQSRKRRRRGEEADEGEMDEGSMASELEFETMMDRDLDEGPPAPKRAASAWAVYNSECRARAHAAGEQADAAMIR